MPYDRGGNIINVARVWALPEDLPHPFADLADEHRILANEKPEGELREATSSEIPHQFRVNTDTEFYLTAPA